MRALQTLPEDLWTQLQVVDDESNLLLDLGEATGSSKSEDEADGCTNDGKPNAPLKVCRYHPQMALSAA